MNFSMYAHFYKEVKTHGIRYTAKHARRLGFTSVEFFEFIGRDWQDTVPDLATAKKFRRILKRHGLTVACYSIAAGLYDANSPDGIDHRAEEKLMAYAERAAALGCPYLHHTITIGCPTDLDYDKMLKTVLPAVVRVAKHAQTLGVTCIYEDQGNYFNGVEGFGTFFRAVKAEEPSVGVCGDVGNTLFVDEAPDAFFRAFANEIRHVHVKDYVPCTEQDSGSAPTREGAFVKECVVGCGIVDIAACLAPLKELGYTGAVALENNHAEDFDAGVATAMQVVSTNLEPNT